MWQRTSWYPRGPLTENHFYHLWYIEAKLLNLVPSPPWEHVGHLSLLALSCPKLRLFRFHSSRHCSTSSTRKSLKCSSQWMPLSPHVPRALCLPCLTMSDHVPRCNILIYFVIISILIILSLFLSLFQFFSLLKFSGSLDSIASRSFCRTSSLSSNGATWCNVVQRVCDFCVDSHCGASIFLIIHFHFVDCYPLYPCVTFT